MKTQFTLFIFLFIGFGCSEPTKTPAYSNTKKTNFYMYTINDNKFHISLDMPSFLQSKFSNSSHTICWSPYCLKDSTGFEYFYLSFDQVSSGNDKDLSGYTDYALADAGDDLKKKLTSRTLTIDNKRAVFNDCLSKEKGRRYYRAFAAIHLGKFTALLNYRISELRYRADPSMIFQSVNSFKLDGIDSTGKVHGLEM